MDEACKTKGGEVIAAYQKASKAAARVVAGARRLQREKKSPSRAAINYLNQAHDSFVNAANEAQSAIVEWANSCLE